MKQLTLLLLLMPTITFANDIFKPIVNCSTSEIVKILPNNYKERIETVNITVNKIANELDVDACLLLSMVWTESTFKAYNRSNKGAKGLLQVMPRTHRETRLMMNYRLNKMITNNLSSNLAYEEIENLIIGSFYYKRLLLKFNGNVQKAVIAYNMGPNYVLKNKVSSKHLYFKKVNDKFNLIAVK